MLRLLNEARFSGIRLAIASSTSPANVRAVCDGSLPGDWADWFDIVATCDVVEAKKPSAAVYRYVLQHTGWRASECVAIEDTPNGNRAAPARVSPLSSPPMPLPMTATSTGRRWS